MRSIIFLISISYVSIYAQELPETATACTPANDEHLGDVGFCIDSKHLSKFCHFRDISRSDGCPGKENWCCYKRFMLPPSLEGRQDLAQQTPNGACPIMNNDPQPDLNQTAMLIIDAQVGTMTWARSTPLQYAQKYIIALANTSKVLGLPLVLTSSLENNTDVQGPLMAQLQTIAPTEYANRIKRIGVISAWDDPNYRNAVYATGKKQLVIAGFLTDVCIVHTVCQARAEGFKVWVVLDAVGSPTAPAEWASRLRITQCGAFMTSTNGILANIVKDWSTPLGQAAIENLVPALIPGVNDIGA